MEKDQRGSKNSKEKGDDKVRVKRWKEKIRSYEEQEGRSVDTHTSHQRPPH